MLKSILFFAKKCYQLLPFDSNTKAAHRTFIQRYFPMLLDASISVKRNLLSNKLDHIEISSSESPIVSVIIPVYGKIDYTLRCLSSIAQNLPETPFEVLVVDDHSPDNSVEEFKKVKGIRLLLNSRNQAFIRSCNKGAKEAKGKYLYFLNNDTEVLPGWLDHLLRTFSDLPGTGLAGSKLLYPDGSLQEAGGIIWSDGSAWNYGRNQNPDLPEFNYAREVDYCSGASIMVPKELFEKLGGFDELYLPAYCEDSDLALKLRGQGYRVIYQPFSVVVHHEGITSGRDLTQGIKAYQIKNNKKLFEQWKSRLQSYQRNGQDLNLAKDRRSKKRILVLDNCTPTPDQDAGSVTIFNLMLLFRELGFQVTFIPQDNYMYMETYTPLLQGKGIEVLYSPFVQSVLLHVKEQGMRYDLVLLTRPDYQHHLQPIRSYCPKAKVIYLPMDLHFLRMSREAQLQADPVKMKAANEMKIKELKVFKACEASLVHSPIEIELLKNIDPALNLYMLPLVLDIIGTQTKFDQRKDIIFFGGYQHPPNVDAVFYFVSEMMPLMREKLPGVSLHIVGSRIPESIQKLACKDIIIAGYVENLTAYLDQMRVCIAPLRYGAGVKGKVGTAMATGLPVVASSIAAEGMFLDDGVHFLQADDPAAFVRAITQIYTEVEVWNHLSNNGLSFAEKTWSIESTWRTMASILKEFGIECVREAYPLSVYKGLT